MAAAAAAINIMSRTLQVLITALCLATAPLQSAVAADSTLIVSTIRTLDFGSFAVLGSCSNCSITINPVTGTRTTSGGIILKAGGSPGAAQYNVDMRSCGKSCSAYAATVSPASVTMSGGSSTWTVGSFTTAQSSTTTHPNILYVGAKLTIPSGAGITAGTKTSASFTITTTP